MKKYVKEELLKAIIDYSNKLGRTPKMKEISCNKDLPPINQFLKNFGSWNNLLKTAELNINAVGEYQKEYLLGILKKSCLKLGRTPKMEDFKLDKDLPAPITYFKKFGSWNNALIKAGLEINEKKNYSKEELIESLLNLKKLLRKNPTSNDLGKRNNMPDRSVFEDRFGSWNNALKAAELKVKYLHRKWTKEQLMQKLKEKSKELGRCPPQKELDKDPLMPAKGNYRKYFGSWNNAVRKAGLDVNYNRSKEELIKILRKLAKKLNRTPTRNDVNNAKEFLSYNPFVLKFGSYTAACLRASLIPNDGRNNNIWKAWEKHCVEMAKIIYGRVEVKNKNVVEGIPDIYVKDLNLFIDAKTCGYRDFKEQIKRYCKQGHRLELWCIFKGIENKSKKVSYVYADELAKKMKKSGRKDLSVKCYQFLRNVFDEGQKTLV